MATEKKDLGRSDVGKKEDLGKEKDVGKQGGEIGKEGGMPHEKKEWEKPGEKKEWEKKKEGGLP